MTGRIENETDLIQTYLAPLAAGYPGALGLKDDAAFLSPPVGTDIVITTDPIIAGVHFFSDERADDIAWKALAVNVSDLAAKGAVPVAYTMSLALPEAPERAWMTDFAAGLAAAQTTFGCHLIGGDTDRTSGPLSISITAFGAVPRGKMVQRMTPRLGDHVFVTGTIGDAALGLLLLGDPALAHHHMTGGDRAFLIGRYLRPSPRIEAGPLLREVATAALDVSDGLVKDVGRLAGAAGGSIALNFKDVPLSPPARHMTQFDAQYKKTIVSGGDDYEVLFTVSPERVDEIAQLGRACPFQITRLGQLMPGSGVSMLDESGGAITAELGGYDHFT